MDGYNLLMLMLLFPHHCKAFVFTSSPNATTTACDGDTATFNWTFSSGSASSVTWTKLNDDLTANATLASFSVGSFLPETAYGSRVTQVGNAGITLSGVTPADDGIYQVEVADFSSSLKGTTTTLTVFDIPSGAIRASYSINTNLVKCDGLSSLGYGSLSLVPSGREEIRSNESLSIEYTPSTGGKYCCCVRMRSDSARCLPAGESYTNCSSKCVEVVTGAVTNTSSPSVTRLSATTTHVSTTETSSDHTTLSIVDVTLIVVFSTVGILIVTIIFVCIHSRRRK